MDWKQHFHSRTVDSAAQAVSKVQSGQRVATGHACASPDVLVCALMERARDLRGVEIMHMVASGKCPFCLPEYEGSFRPIGMFSGAPTRQAVNEGRGDYVPTFFHEVPGMFSNGLLPLDVALVSVCPPDEHGFVSLGISVDYTLAAVRNAKLVIAEVNPNMPRTRGQSTVHVSEIDYFLHVNEPLIVLPQPVPGEIENRIGQNVASMIYDGDCLQIGIGAIPEATLGCLGGKNDLGIHSEMISDGVMHLVQSGNITNSRKQLLPGISAITFAMGSPAFYKWLDNNEGVHVLPVDYINMPHIAGQNDNLVSINSALSVDLLGQVTAEALGTKQFTGVGGQVDFIRAAQLSKGGRSFIALPSTAAKGTVSRICVATEPGQPITTSRNDIECVVTEHGIAYLRGKSLRARAEALINIADPKFRDQLRVEAQKLYGFMA